MGVQYIVGLILVVLVGFIMLVALVCCCIPQPEGGQSQVDSECDEDDLSSTSLDLDLTDPLPLASPKGIIHQPPSLPELKFIVEDLSSVLLCDPETDETIQNASSI